MCVYVFVHMHISAVYDHCTGFGVVLTAVLYCVHADVPSAQDPWAEGLWTTLAELQPPVMSSEDAGDERYEAEAIQRKGPTGRGGSGQSVDGRVNMIAD